MDTKEYLKKYFPLNYKVYNIKKNSFHIHFMGDNWKNNLTTKSYKTAKYIAKELRKQVKKDLKITIYKDDFFKKFYIDVEAFEPYMIIDNSILVYTWFYNRNNVKTILDTYKIIHVL